MIYECKMTSEMMAGRSTCGTLSCMCPCFNICILCLRVNNQYFTGAVKSPFLFIFPHWTCQPLSSKEWGTRVSFISLIHLSTDGLDYLEPTRDAVGWKWTAVCCRFAAGVFTRKRCCLGIRFYHQFNCHIFIFFLKVQAAEQDSETWRMESNWLPRRGQTFF